MCRAVERGMGGGMGAVTGSLDEFTDVRIVRSRPCELSES